MFLCLTCLFAVFTVCFDCLIVCCNCINACMRCDFFVSTESLRGDEVTRPMEEIRNLDVRITGSDCEDVGTSNIVIVPKMVTGHTFSSFFLLMLCRFECCHTG